MWGYGDGGVFGRVGGWGGVGGVVGMYLRVFEGICMSVCVGIYMSCVYEYFLGVCLAVGIGVGCMCMLDRDVSLNLRGRVFLGVNTTRSRMEKILLASFA